MALVVQKYGGTSVANAERIRRKISTPKMTLFVVDYSGSMDGPKIRSVRKGALKLFNDQINPQDKVGIVVFNYASHTIQPLIPVEDNEQKIKKHINTLKYPQGLTAFYDALGEALIFLNEEKSRPSQQVFPVQRRCNLSAHNAHYAHKAHYVLS